MDGQSGERLSGPLGESNVTELRRSGSLQNVVNRVRNVVLRKASISEKLSIDPSHHAELVH